MLGVCRLTWAQAAICHPTLASLILILSPARPSRPAVSSPQKGFLLGGCSGGGAGETKAGSLWELGSSAVRPFDLVPGPAGQTVQTDSTVSTPRRLLLLLSLLSATQTPGADGETEERGRRKRQREGEGGGQMSTMKRLTRTTLPPPIHLWVRISLFPTGRLLPSPLLPCVTLLLSVPPFITQQPQPGRLCVAKHAPTGHLYATVFLKVCQIHFLLLERHV